MSARIEFLIEFDNLQIDYNLCTSQVQTDDQTLFVSARIAIFS